MTDYDGSVLSYVYDSVGRVTSMDDYHNNVTSYTYTNLDQLDTITAPGNRVWNFDYNANGMPTHYSHPNGMLTQYAYDNQNRLTDIEHRDGMTVKQGFAYTFDDNSNVKSVTHEDGSSWAYTYDGRDRLTLAIRYDASAVEEYREAYTYDAGDNLLTKTVTEAGQSPVTTTYTVNDANELLTQSDGATNISYTYDAAGRQASKTDGTYTTINSWRFADMLYKVETDDPAVPDVTYDYGGNKMRRQRTDSDGGYTWYNYAGFSLQSEEDALGALERTYIGRLADLTGSDPGTATARYFTHDMLGSTRGVWDGLRNPLGTLEYTPYGEIYSHTLPSDVQQHYTFHPLDADSGLHYAYFRYYDPTTARWLSRDPIGMRGGLNMFAYVGGNPIGFVDPLGDRGFLAKLVLRFERWLLRKSTPTVVEQTTATGRGANRAANTTESLAGDVIQALKDEANQVPMVPTVAPLTGFATTANNWQTMKEAARIRDQLLEDFDPLTQSPDDVLSSASEAVSANCESEAFLPWDFQN